jgi:hypothetical protein
MNEPGNDNDFKGTLARSISKIVLYGTAAIGITGILFATVTLWRSDDDDGRKEAFSILQYVFGALLPLWGTWIGTVLAYYFSRENFESANRSVQQLVDKITSDKKLQTVRARDVMIPLEKLVFQELKTGEDLSKFRLKEECIDFLSAKGIKRIILLDEAQKAKYVIHRDLISFFLAEQSLAGNNVVGLTLKDMYQNGNPDIKNTMDNCIRFVNDNATLFDAKQIMSQVKTCQDVFITKNGSADEPVTGWITNVTIIENSVV